MGNQLEQTSRRAWQLPRDTTRPTRERAAERRIGSSKDVEVGGSNTQEVYGCAKKDGQRLIGSSKDVEVRGSNTEVAPRMPGQRRRAYLFVGFILFSSSFFGGGGWMLGGRLEN